MKIKTSAEHDEPSRERPFAPTATCDGPFVSIIILNLNGEKILERCIECVLQQTYRSFELIVVENGSRDGSRELVSRLTPRIEQRVGSDRFRLITSEVNLGAAGGRNLGIAAARGEFVAFVDNDGYAADTFLAESVDRISFSSEIGATSAAVFLAAEPEVFNGLGGALDRRGYGWDLRYLEKLGSSRISFEPAAPGTADDVVFPMGCGMLVRREVLTKIGELDCSGLKWFEDVELGLRIWAAGYRVVTAPRAWVDHDLRTSDRVLFLPGWKIKFSYEKMRIRTVLQCFPALNLIKWCGYEAFALCGLGVRLRFRELAVVSMALAWNILRAPSAFRRRLNWKAGKGRNGAGKFRNLLEQCGSPPPELMNSGANEL